MAHSKQGRAFRHFGHKIFSLIPQTPTIHKNNKT